MKRVIEGSRERLWGLLALGSFLLFNLLTATAYPVPWLDDCEVSEPAVSFFYGHGYIFRFSEMLGMYTILLVPWMKVFGASLQSVRSADIVCMTAAFFVLWSAVKRLDLVTHAAMRFLLLFLLATEYAMIFAYRSGRYDGFGALIMVVVLWIMSIREKRMRIALLSAICLFVPWAGLQFMPLLFTAGLVLFLFFRWKYWMEIAASYLASAVGAGCFLLCVYFSGRLPGYLKSVHASLTGPAIFAHWFRTGEFHHSNFLPKDLSLAFLFPAAVLLLIALLRDKQITRRSVLSFALLFTVLLVCIQCLVSKFPTYYCYMVVIPLTIAICAGLPKCKAGALKSATLLLCLLSVLAGAGLNFAAWAYDRQDRSYARIEQFIGSVIRADDIAYVDHEGYLAARPLAKDVYLPTIPGGGILLLLSQQQKDSITVLVIHPEELSEVLKTFGGDWQMTGKLAPTQRSLFGDRNLGFVTFRPNTLVALRRRSR
jgi:hypothetical protein